MTTQEELVKYIEEKSNEIKERVIREGYVDDETYGKINSILYELLADWYDGE